jgi:outer membrane biosynthesis protein TonB
MRPYKGMSDEEFLKGLVVQDPKAPGYEAPKVLGHPSPKYNSEAMRNKIQGVVRLEVVVMPDGTVSRARIVGATWTIGLETTGGQPPTAVADAQGLDEEALNTIKRWTFTPATVNGTPVTAVVSTDMAYKIF